MKKNLKKFTAILAAAALTLSLTACSGGQSAQEDTGAASESTAAAQEAGDAGEESASTGRTDLNLRIPDAFSTLDPHMASLNADILMNHQIYDPLYWLEDDGTEVPMLATEYSVSDDGLTWTFKLRDGVTFQNGDPLKASDVVYSLDRCASSPYFQESVESIDSSEATDDSTVVLHLKYPFSPLLGKLANVGIVSEAFTEANVNEEGSLGTNACGTGAYTVSEVIPDVSVTLEAYPGYWGGEAPIKTLHFEQIVDDSTAVTAFEAGEIDLMTIPSSNWEEIASNDAYNTAAVPSNHVVYLIFNVEAAPFDNQLVRQAIAYAVNRQDIIDMVANGLATPATSIATSYMFGFTEDHVTYDYDPEKAKELLAEAGYPDGLDIGVIKTLGGTYFEKVVQVVQSELSEIGITCTIESLDGNSLVSDCFTGNFTMCDMGQSMTLDYDFMRTFYHSDYVDGMNMARFSDPKIDELFAQGASETDKDARLAIYKEIEDLTQEACAYIPLYNLQTTTAWNKDLNFTYSVNGNFYKDASWN